jgi:hypothetical protein
MNQAKGGRGMDAHTWEDAIGEGPQHHLKKDQNRCENSAGTTMQSTCTQQQLQTNKQTKVSWAPNFRVILQWKGKKFELHKYLGNPKPVFYLCFFLFPSFPLQETLMS